VLLLTLTGTTYYLIIFYNDLEENNRQQQQLRKLVREAELKALKSQLNPHFLFNSLNSISSLTITDADKAREMINKLSDFMRYSLRQNDLSLLPLKEEMENIWRYLEIERVRFGDRLVIETEVSDDCYALKVPPMILQPLYENAVKHGVYESIEPVCIRTYCIRQNDSLSITIINNYDPESIPKRGEGVGLENIRNRLRMLFHCEGLLQTVRENNHFEATLIIPQIELQ
jgi:LytS/YehU family sensor histidine kinase